MEERIQQMEQEVTNLKYMISLFMHPDNYKFEKTKMGFFGVTPVSQQAVSSGLDDHTGSGGTTVTGGTKFNGNIGSTYYGFGDLIKCMKNLGLIKK